MLAVLVVKLNWASCTDLCSSKYQSVYGIYVLLFKFCKIIQKCNHPRPFKPVKSSECRYKSGVVKSYVVASVILSEHSSEFSRFVMELMYQGFKHVCLCKYNNLLSVWGFDSVRTKQPYVSGSLVSNVCSKTHDILSMLKVVSGASKFDSDRCNTCFSSKEPLNTVKTLILHLN